MNNCLVTKLNGIVNNDSLLKIGEVKFFVIGATYDLVIDKNHNDTKVYDTNGNLVAAADPDSDVTSFSFNNWSQSGNIVTFTNKYSIRAFSLPGVTSDLNVDVFKFSSQETNGQHYFEINCPNVTGKLSSLMQFFESTTLRRIQIKNCFISGSLSDIANLPNKNTITTIRFNDASNIKGNLENLVSFTALTELNVAGSEISLNTMKEFLDGMAELRSSGNLSIVMGDNYIENNAGLTRKDSLITFSSGSWSQTN